MNKEYFKKYYELERSHWWFKVRGSIITDFIKRYISQKEQLKILNVGCATGKTSELLNSFGIVKSVEYDIDICNFCNTELNIDVINASITSLPFEEDYFDLVCAFDVIEHVEEHQQAVNEMWRVCKKGGHIFVTVPAFMSLWSDHDKINHHFRRYEKKQLTNLFQLLNGNIIKATYFNSILFPFIYVVRKLSNKIGKFKTRKTIKSDFETINTSSINFILKLIFSFERILMRKITFPFGVSFALIWKKG